MAGTGRTAPQIADSLALPAGRPVLDKTGLSERYTYALRYTPFSSHAAGTAPEFAPPDFFTAVREQMGLELVPAKASIEVVVIDHIERTPSEN